MTCLPTAIVSKGDPSRAPAPKGPAAELHLLSNVVQHWAQEVPLASSAQDYARYGQRKS